MHLRAILSILLFTLIPSHALPDGSSDDWDGQDGHFPRHGCLNHHAAAQIVSTFEQFFVHIDPVIADKFLTPDFELFSDSTNYLNQSANMTPGAVTASSRAIFIDQQVDNQNVTQPNFTTLAVYHTCDTITFRWHLNFPTPVAGIDVLIVEPGTHMVKTDFSEYNSFGLLLNFGSCNSTPT